MLELLEQVRMVTEERRDLEKKKTVSALVLAYTYKHIPEYVAGSTKGRQAG
jgi:hypothetical protein